ncbi:MAG: DUF4129 domain-containing protein [Sphaerobacter sp.]|nr:DUF4129 domain-containing protein [Sphaerobacter sp.]
MIARDPLGLVTIAHDLRRRIDWREEMVALALMVAESAIVYLYLGGLLPAITPPYAPFPGWLIGLLLALAYVVPRLLDALRVWGARYELVLALALLASLLLALKVAAFPSAPWLATGWLRGALDGLIVRPNPAIRPPWAIVGVVAYAWWRGRTRAEPMLETTYQMLRWGTLAAAGGLLLVLLGAPAASPIRERMASAVVLYFVAALAAVSLARSRLEGLRSGSPLGPPWLATFALPIAAVVLVAVLAAGLVSRHLLEALLAAFGPLLWGLGLAARALVLLVALLAFIVISPVLWLLERTGFGTLPLLERLPRATSPLAQLDRVAREVLHIADPARYLIAGAVLALLGSALVRYAHRRRHRWRDTVAERRESVLAWEDAVGGLARPLRRAARRLRPRGDPLAHLRADPRWAHTLAIRETYIRLLRRGARAGLPRPADVTPAEYARRLAAHAPDDAAAIAQITAHYEAARYRAEPATPEEAAAVRAAWAALTGRPPAPRD